MRRTANYLNSLEKTMMLIIKRGHKRHFDVKRATALVVLIIFVFLVEPNVTGQTKPVEDHLAEIAKRIADISRDSNTPDGVTLHGKKEWHCASAALRRTESAIEWVQTEEGVTKTLAAATKAVADIVSLGGAARAGLALDILSAYVRSDTVEEFTHELAEIALGKAFGKVLEKTGKTDEEQRELIKILAEKIWKALGGAKEPISVVKIWKDPLCGNINIELRLTTEGVTEAPRPEAENLVRKNCEKRCAEARNKWLDERSAAIASAREAKTQEENLYQAQLKLGIAQADLKSASSKLEALNREIREIEDAMKGPKSNVNPGKRRQELAQRQMDKAQMTEAISKLQSEINGLTDKVADLTKLSPEARALAEKALKAAKAAEDAYRMCLKSCYDEASKSGLDRDKEQARKLESPLTIPVEKLLEGPPSQLTPEPTTKSSRKKILHFIATGDCHCNFPPRGAPDNELLGPFGVTGIAELIPQNPVVEGKTIAINYKLDTVKFDVVATCGCPAESKSQTATPKETKTETQSARPTSQPEQKSETANYYLPSGMERLNQTAAPASWTSPFAPLGACPCYYCCCNCGVPIYSNVSTPGFVSVRLSQAMDKLGVGRSIHVSYGKGGYVAETYLQWAASGGPGLTVDLEVQRPRSNTFEKLATGRRPNDTFLFETKIPGTYLFRATAKDSSGKSSFNTLSVTFPFIDTEPQPSPKQ